MKLDSLEIEGFKSIREATLDLRSLNLMIGANGAGKSNLVAAFGLLNQIVEKRLQSHIARKGGASAQLFNGPKHSQSIRLKVVFGQNAYEAKLEFAQDDTLFFGHEECFFHDKAYPRPYEVSLGSGHRESLLEEKARQKKLAKYVLDALRSWTVYHFHDTSDGAAVKRLGKIDDSDKLRPDASNLAAFLFWLREAHEDSYKRIVAAVRLVAPFFHDFRLRPDRVRKDEIQLLWSERESDAYFNAHALSDGTLRFICLSTLLLQPQPPSLILIDEPELGLHPYAVHQLAALLRSAARKTQILAATQSVTLMNQFDPEDVIVVDRADGQSTFRRIEVAEIAAWKDDYALGELWEKAVLGGRPRR